jgi:hypothetical protein
MTMKPGNSMRLFYPLYLTFPATVARAVQVMHTTDAMARQGMEVHLLTATVNDRWENIRLSYALDAIAPDGWHGVALPSMMKRPGHRFRLSSRLPYDFNLKRFLKCHARAGDWLFVRERKTAQAVVGLAKRLKLRLL